MAPVTSYSPRSLGHRFPWVCALFLLLSAPALEAGSPRLYVVQYSLVSEAQTPDGTDYVFRGRLLNLGPAIPGAVARLTGESPAATVLDGELSFGPVDRFGVAWSTDTAAIRRHGRWRDIIFELRWAIDIAAGNRAPMAAAGPDQAAQVLDRVLLDGSASTDPDGDPLTYQWSFVTRPAGSAAAFSDPAAVRPEFVVDVPGRYVAALVVRDGRLASAPDLVEVATINGAPVADAGPDARLVVGAVAVLDGSGSTDPDGDRLDYMWAIVDRPTGSQATLDDPAAVRPTFVADLAGRYVVRLVVSDGQLVSPPDTVTLTTENTLPVAAAGPDQHIAVGETVMLDGSGSTDVDGDALTFVWALVSVPPGSAAALVSPTSVNPHFTADVAGEYVVQLVVNDGSADSPPDTVLVSTLNTRPVAAAGLDRTVTVGEVVVVDGSGSSDADGDPLSYAWALVATPAGSGSVLQTPTAAVSSFVADRPGDYVLQLVVHDGQIDSAADTLVVSTVNSTPIADAGPDQTDVAPGAAVVLDGSGSSDPDGQPLHYAWALLSRPPASSATLTGADSVAPSFMPDVAGTYVAQLVVNDGFVDGAPDTVRISTVNAPPSANAGPDQTVAAGATVQLDGSGSIDAEGAALTYRWTLATQPVGSSATLSDTAAVAPTFVADAPGQYTLQLVVDDGMQASTPDFVVVTATAPAVGVTATDGAAAERGPDAGQFTLSRTGPVGAALTVDIALRGSAGNGLDYDLIGDTVTFAAGEALATVVVTPTPDAEVEGDETVTLDLLAGTGYVLGSPASAMVTIADDPRPVLSIAATDPQASEDGDPGAFTVSLTGSPGGPLLVNLEISGTATAGVDFAPLPATVAIPGNTSAVTLHVSPIDDAAFEATESVVVRLVAGNGYVVGSPALSTVSIEDDDTLVSVVATDATASETGNDTATFTVSRQGNTSGVLTVSYSVAGTASAGGDYVQLSGAATFAPGATETTIAVAPVDDLLIEGPETVVVMGEPGAGYRLSAVAQATITILDDERPGVSIRVSDAQASEAGPDVGAFEITRTGPTTGSLEVELAVTGAAAEGLDYQSLGGRVTIPVGASGALLPIVPIDDSLVEGAEVVVVSLAANPAYVVVVPGIAALSIADDDLGAVTIEATDPNASEGGLDPGLFTLRRSGDPAAPLTVSLGRSGSAIDGDYEPLGALVTFPAGESALAIQVVPRADNLVEGPEQLTVTVMPNLAYAVGVPASATVTIADDPAIISIIASAPAAAESGLTPGAFLLTRSGGHVGSALSVSVAIGGSGAPNVDYVVVSGVVTFPAGLTAVSIPIVPLADNVVEADDTVTMTINPSVATAYTIGAPSTATVSIADDPPVVEMVTLDAAAAEAGLDPAVAQVRRTGGNLAAPLNVFFVKSGTAANGFDYQSLGGGVSVVTIPAGQVSATVTVTPVADNVVEAPETVILTLTTSAAYVIGASDTATVTIADDPPVVEVVATDPDASETGPDAGAFTFTRRGGNLAQALTVAITRAGTAGVGSDYGFVPASVTIPAGQPSVTLAITPIDDALVEGAETVVVTVNASASVTPGAAATATITIGDND